MVRRYFLVSLGEDKEFPHDNKDHEQVWIKHLVSTKGIVEFQ